RSECSRRRPAGHRRPARHDARPRLRYPGPAPGAEPRPAGHQGDARSGGQVCNDRSQPVVSRERPDAVRQWQAGELGSGNFHPRRWRRAIRDTIVARRPRRTCGRLQPRNRTAMTANRHFETVSFWLECVANTIAAAFGRMTSPRAVRLVEDERDGTFGIESDSGRVAARLRIVDGHLVGQLPADVTASLRGSALQLILRPHPFLFRPLELPARAAEYLAGIVRAQIDRLTPWSAEDAVFGWSSPSALDADRIKITIAATARAKIAPCLQA